MGPVRHGLCGITDITAVTADSMPPITMRDFADALRHVRSPHGFYRRSVAVAFAVACILLLLLPLLFVFLLGLVCALDYYLADICAPASLFVVSGPLFCGPEGTISI